MALGAMAIRCIDGALSRRVVAKQTHTHQESNQKVGKDQSKRKVHIDDSGRMLQTLPLEKLNPGVPVSVVRARGCSYRCH